MSVYCVREHHTRTIMKFACLLANGFEETEMISVVDLLRRAKIDVDLVSIGALHVTGSHGVTVIADKLWNDMAAYDGLFLPGGQPGTNNLGNDERVLNLIKEYVNKDKWVTAICAAPSVLAKAGVLKGKRVTSYPMSNVSDIFNDAQYSEDFVVQDGKIITSRGVGTALHFGLHLVEALGYDAKTLSDSILFTLVNK